jgi:hypothetical protein
MPIEAVDKGPHRMHCYGQRVWRILCRSSEVGISWHCGW